MTATPTDAERETAAKVLDASPAVHYGREASNRTRDAIAQAFADHRAPYEALADELDPVEVALSGVDYVAERIRQVAATPLTTKENR